MYLKPIIASALLLIIVSTASSQRRTQNFDKSWRFHLGDDSAAIQNNYNDASWRLLNLPHDWSIEGPFSSSNPSTIQQAALPTGIAWYRKTFTLPPANGKRIYIEFDGVYRNSEVWINGHSLGLRPYGYSSFRYELTPWLRKPGQRNCIAVRVNNTAQPDSRWYTGSGIYRHVRLVTTAAIAIDHWGVTVGARFIDAQTVRLPITINISNASPYAQGLTVLHELYDAAGRKVTETKKVLAGLPPGTPAMPHMTELVVDKPKLWSADSPYLYRLVTSIKVNGKTVDACITPVGIRHFSFDAAHGFFLNGRKLELRGVCMHHDLGALGAAVNTRAMERQLQLLKAMGCNAIRTAHNPPAPEWLDLCDRMGFLVLDEAFDMWRKRKNKYDYHLDFDKWHAQDLQDMVRRDRNHPSVIAWSIGNEIREQFDSSGITIARELVALVKQLDTTRPVTCALSESDPKKNFIYQSGALDIVGLNYHPEVYPGLDTLYPGQKVFASETTSALATRGHYDPLQDTTVLWPARGEKQFTKGNPDYTVSAYDNVAAYWGATHEDAWLRVKNCASCAGLFVWSGFDFLGEPVPYTSWPSRSSYYGIIDLAGFPKDVYYMYQSEWTEKPVLHLLPHWNWRPKDTVDVVAYYSQADDVELFLNGQSLGIQKKPAGKLHARWRVPYAPGALKAVSRRNGQAVLSTEIHTAGPAAAITLQADRNAIEADGNDLSFITARVTDARGIPVPDAAHHISFTIEGPAVIAGTDNGYQAGLEPFPSHGRNAWKGKCLVILRSKEKSGSIRLKATAEGLPPATITILSRPALSGN